MNLNDLKGLIVLLVFITLLASASAIALDDFDDDLTAGSYASNITNNGLEGIDNATSYFDTTGTIAGVAILISIVAAAFYFGKK